MAVDHRSSARAAGEVRGDRHSAADPALASGAGVAGDVPLAEGIEAPGRVAEDADRGPDRGLGAQAQRSKPFPGKLHQGQVLERTAQAGREQPRRYR